MNEKLKPCPCCGGEGAVWDKSRYDVCVRCDACELQTKWHPTISDAIAAWNRRADGWTVDEMADCKMAGGENEIGDSVFCCFMDAYVMKEDCGGNCENYLPEKGAGHE